MVLDLTLDLVGFSGECSIYVCSFSWEAVQYFMMMYWSTYKSWTNDVCSTWEIFLSSQIQQYDFSLKPLEMVTLCLSLGTTCLHSIGIWFHNPCLCKKNDIVGLGSKQFSVWFLFGGVKKQLLQERGGVGMGVERFILVIFNHFPLTSFRCYFSMQILE